MGLIPAWAPRTLQDARIRGRRSVEDLVDRHHLRHRQVRDLLVDYIRRRSAEVDYGTLENLVRSLVEYFWKIIEDISPGQADLRLSEQQVQAWKERLLVRKDGKPRAHIEAPPLLGHLNIQTTRGYVAVFEEDVVRHYQEFLDRRRARRPEGEYRQPTREEWSDFNEHFDKRKVELGSCGRPYGTPCAHEHACVRCPMLSVNPKMLPRLDELEADLIARGQRAADEGWHG